MAAPQTFYPKISADVPWETRQHLQLIYQKLDNHAQAIVANHTAASVVKTEEIIQQIPTGGGGGGGGGSTLPGLGGINNQTGQTAYTTQSSDAGILVVLSDASPVAVTLNAGVTVPWMAFFANQGAGLVTLTPQTGVINYAGNPGASSMPLDSGLFTLIVFDGVNWWAATIPNQPQSITAVTHEFLTSYDSATGLFTQAQPDFTDISGTASVAQIPNLPESKITGLTADLAAKAPIASPAFTGTVTQPDASVLTAATTATSATAGAATALPATPEGYLEISINGTFYKVPYYAV